MIEILKNIPFFSNLNENDLQEISQMVQLQYFPSNHTIFSEGDEGDLMYVIKRGLVQVFRGSEALGVLKNGAFFGEMALVSNEPRNATLKTVSDLEVLTLGREHLEKLMQNNSSIATQISYEVVKRSH